MGWSCTSCLPVSYDISPVDLWRVYDFIMSKCIWPLLRTHIKALSLAWTSSNPSAWTISLVRIVFGPTSWTQSLVWWVPGPITWTLLQIWTDFRPTTQTPVSTSSELRLILSLVWMVLGPTIYVSFATDQHNSLSDLLISVTSLSSSWADHSIAVTHLDGFSQFTWPLLFAPANFGLSPWIWFLGWTCLRLFP